VLRDCDGGACFEILVPPVLAPTFLTTAAYGRRDLLRHSARRHERPRLHHLRRPGATSARTRSRVEHGDADGLWTEGVSCAFAASLDENRGGRRSRRLMGRAKATKRSPANRFAVDGNNRAPSHVVADAGVTSGQGTLVLAYLTCNTEEDSVQTSASCGPLATASCTFLPRPPGRSVLRQGHRLDRNSDSSWVTLATGSFTSDRCANSQHRAVLISALHRRPPGCHGPWLYRHDVDWNARPPSNLLLFDRLGPEVTNIAPVLGALHRSLTGLSSRSPGAARLSCASPTTGPP